MKIVITGGAGFLGQAIARECRAPRRDYGGRPELVAYDLQSADGMPTVRGDINDGRALRAALEGADAVIHCATVVAWSDLRAPLLERVNVEGTRSVVRACREAGVKAFVHTSTMDVVCGDGPVRGVDETAPYPTRYLDCYGRAKAESERVVRAEAGELPFAILRCSAMYGEADPYKVPSILAEARAGRLLFRVGDGRAHMQPLYVGNAAIAVLLAVGRLLDGDRDVVGQTFFLTDHPSENFFDWMEPIVQGLGYRIPSRALPRPVALALGALMEGAARAMGAFGSDVQPAMTRSSVRALTEDVVVDGSRARLCLGYEPLYDYDEAVARTIAWFKRPPVEGSEHAG
jgi:nucleoside-diphosphate-sugar epimerase